MTGKIPVRPGGEIQEVKLQMPRPAPFIDLPVLSRSSEAGLVLDTGPVDVDHRSADRDLWAAIARGVLHARLSEIPATLAPWLLPVEWSRERLWAIERQPVQLPVVALRWLYDLPLWRAQDGRWFMVTPREFLRDPAGYPEHEQRVAGADLSRPVHALWRRDRWFLIDGVHRLVKADRAGWSTIPAVVVGPEDLPSFIEQVRI